MSESEQIHLHLSDYFTASPDLVCIASKEGYFKKVNDTVVRLLGYSREELFARPIASFIVEEDKARTYTTRQKLLQGETLVNFSNRYITKSGGIIWLEWTSIYFPENEIVLGLAKDITVRKNNELQIEANYNRYKELATHFKTSLEKDRESLAYGLHEELAQLAASVKMELDIIPIAIPDLPGMALSKIALAAEKTKLLLEEIQRLSFSISPALLQDFGLIATLQWLAKEFTRIHNIPCNVTSAFNEDHLNKEIKTDFFRICQEALDYVMLYDAPASVTINIHETPQQITLSIADKGRGFNPDKMPAADALKNIRERAKSIHGKFEVQTAPGQGTRLIVVVQK